MHMISVVLYDFFCFNCILLIAQREKLQCSLKFQKVYTVLQCKLTKHTIQYK